MLCFSKNIIIITKSITNLFVMSKNIFFSLHEYEFSAAAYFDPQPGARQQWLCGAEQLQKLPSAERKGGL